MRFLHTADWHIGKNLNDYSLLEQQADLLNQITLLLADDTYDCLVISGDLYDRAQPAKSALELVNKTFHTIIEKYKKPILLIAGNHDSDILIDYGSQLLEKQHLYAQGTSLKEPKTVLIKNTTFHLLPFISPFVAAPLYQREFEDFNDLLTHQINTIKLNPKTYNVLIAHAYVTYESQIFEMQESVRPISIGTAQYVDAKLFADFDYVALGHLHRAQTIVKDKVYYSGAIYKYSKSEANNIISVNDVSFKNNQIIVDKIPLILKKDVKILQDQFEDLLKRKSDDFVYIELLDSSFHLHAINKLRDNYPSILGLEYPKLTTNYERDNKDKEIIKTLSPDQQFENFFEKFSDKKLTISQKKLVKEIFEELNHDH